MSSDSLKKDWSFLLGVGWVSIHGSIAEEKRGWIFYPNEGGVRGPYKSLEDAFQAVTIQSL